uniref:Predicted protein n=1 Tax=Hordeum vulgare subsp. vulgare TaxID=112509 RepID=F2DXI9_HORVV|nr:predicted protein [Hordeum vulgare subsp. vulgare]
MELWNPPLIRTIILKYQLCKRGRSCGKDGSLTLWRRASGHGYRSCRGRGRSPAQARRDDDLETSSSSLDKMKRTSKKRRRNKRPDLEGGGGGRRRGGRRPRRRRYRRLHPRCPTPIGPGDAAAVGVAWVAGGICVPAFPLQRSFLLLNFVR